MVGKAVVRASERFRMRPLAPADPSILGRLFSAVVSQPHSSLFLCDFSDSTIGLENFRNIKKITKALGIFQGAAAT